MSDYEKQKEFDVFVRQSNELPPALSLIHTTDFCRFEAIKTSGVISLSDDKVFKTAGKTVSKQSVLKIAGKTTSTSDDKEFVPGRPEKLSYFFYGRPSYRVNPDIKDTRVSSFAPICFVFKKEFNCTFKRIHPFDTGAFDAGRLSGFVHSTMAMSDYELRPEIASAQRVVNAFYGNNSRYIDCLPSGAIEIEKIVKDRLFFVESYYYLIRYTPNVDSDERAHSIEIQTDESVYLKDNLLAVVVPDRFFEGDNLKEIRDLWNCSVVTYHLKNVFTPVNLMDLLMDKVREVLFADGQLS